MLRSSHGNHDVTHFANSVMESGDFVYRTKKAKHIVKRVRKTKHLSRVIGMTLNNVVEIDNSRYFNSNVEAVLGSKICILTSGTVEIWMDNEELEKGQNIYLHKDGEICWKYSVRQIGVVVKDQDEYGFVQIELSI